MNGTLTVRTDVFRTYCCVILLMHATTVVRLLAVDLQWANLASLP